MTIPERFEDHPAFLNYPGEHGHVRYGEGIFVGYRGFQNREVMPAFPFGHGLGYARFELDEAVAELDGECVRLCFRLRNVSERAGATVVQSYFGGPADGIARPVRELCDFVRVSLEAGENCDIERRIPLARFAYFDPREEEFRNEAGRMRIDVGFSSADLRMQLDVELAEGRFDAPA